MPRQRPGDSPNLLTPLARWGISGMRIVPHTEGLWLALLNAMGERRAAAWWRADAESGTRAPLTIPAAAWVLVHPVCAALWHDLCADAVVLGPRPELHTSPRQDEPSGRRVKTRSTTQRVMLPPARTEHAIWADETDRAALTHATAGGHGYRRLPLGWEERADRTAFQQRQRDAAQRALDYGYPAPPPGFTYVRPFVRGLAHAPAELVAPALLKVRLRDLFTLLLGLQPVALQHEDSS